MSDDSSPKMLNRRITVGLLPKIFTALDKLMEETGMSKTDIVNRAISLYEFVHDNSCGGKRLALVDSEGKVTVINLI